MLGIARDDRGQGLAEYAIIMAFLVVLCIAALTWFGANVAKYYTMVAGKI